MACGTGKKLKAAVANLYYEIPTAADLVGTSYVISDFVDNEPTVEVWDKNWDVLELYRQYSTQWRAAGNGPFALDFSIFFHELNRKRIADDEFDEIVAKLRIIEGEALKWIHRR